MRGAQLVRGFELVVVDVDADDHARATNARALNG